MKKIFPLTHPKIKPARLAESAKSEVKKYIRKQRKKELPKGVDFWDFDCKFGPSAEKAKAIHVADVGKNIDAAEENQLEAFYIEIVPKQGHRQKKPKSNA